MEITKTNWFTTKVHNEQYNKSIVTQKHDRMKSINEKKKTGYTFTIVYLYKAIQYDLDDADLKREKTKKMLQKQQLKSI